MKRGLVKRVERLERVMPSDDFDFHFTLDNYGHGACQEGNAIDLVKLEKRCMLHCTDQEIASYFGVTMERMAQERKSPGFAEVMKRGQAKGKIVIRREQMRLLEKGSSTMRVLLGRQFLGQGVKNAERSFAIRQASPKVRSASGLATRSPSA